MLGSGANGKKPIEEAEKLRARKAKLERVSSELTKHKNADEKLYKAQADWEKTFDAISDWVAMIDLKGRILRTNRSGEDFTSISSAQIVGQSCCKLVHGSEEYIPGCPLQKMLHSRQRERAELKVPDTNRWLLVTVDPVIDKEGNLVGAVHVTRDITDRKRAEEALRESEERYRELFENAGEGIITLDLDGRITEANRVVEEYGFNRAELNGRRLFDFVPEYDKARSVSDFQALIVGSRVQSQMDVITPKGIIAVEYRDTPIVRAGEVIGVQAILTDITQRKKAENEKDELLRTIETAKEAMCIVSPSLIITYTNDAMDELFGYKKDELIGKHVSTCNAGATPEAVAREIGNSIEREGWWEGEVHNIRKDGTEFISYATTSAYRDKDGKIISFLSTQHDITQHKKAEQRLKESEERFRKIVDTAPGYLLITDQDGKNLYVSPHCEKITGYSQNELIGQIIWWVHEDDTSRAKEVFQSAYRDGRPGRNFEYKAVKKNGQIWHASTSWETIKDSKGQLKSVVVQTFDITERKRTEERIEFLGRILETSPISVIATDENVKIIYVNPATENLFGYESEELIGKDPGILNVEPDADKVQMRMLDTIRQKGVWKGELLNKKKNGERFYIQASCCQLFDEEGNFVALVGFQEDITERKRAEEALRESQENYRMVSGLTSDYIVKTKVEPDGQMVLVSATDRLENMTGYAVDEFRSQSSWSKIVHPDDYDKFQDFWKRIVSSRKSCELEFRGINRKQEFEWLHAYGQPILDEKDDRVISIVFAAKDITERKLAEEAYRSLVDHSLQGLSILQDGHVVFANQALADITGHTVDEMLAMSSEQVQAFIHPEDRPLVWSRYRDRLNGEEVPERYEFRGIRKYGSTCWLELHANRVEYQGRPAIQTAYVDITERKKAEEALRSAEKKWVSLTQNTKDYIVIVDNNHIIQYLNKTVPSETSEEVVGTTVYEHIPKEHHDITRETLKKVFKTGIPDSHEVILDKPGFGIIWLYTKMIPIKTNKEVHSVILIATDITERKRAEEAYRSLVDHSLQGLAIFQNGRVVFANQAMVDITSFTVKEMLAMSSEKVQEFVHPEDRELVWSRHQDRLKGKTVPERYEFRGIRKDGSTCWLELHASRIEYQEKPAIQAAYVDITERKKAEEELQKSERQASAAIEAARGFTFNYHIDTGKINWGGAIEEITGYTPKEFSQVDVDGWAERIHPDDRDRVLSILQEAIHVKDRATAEYRFRTKKGDYVILSSISLTEKKGGKAVRLVGILQDVTERKRAEEALRESEEKFKSIFEHANDGVIYLDTAGNILDINEKAARMFGGPKQEAVNKHFTEVGVFPADEIPTFMSNFEKIFAGEEVILTVPIKNKKGQEIILECSASLTKTDDGAGRIMVIARDITERIKASEQIEKLAKFPAENPNPVLRISGRGTVVYANKAGLPLLKSWRCRVGESLPEPWHEFVLDALSSGQNHQTEVQCDGRIFSLTFAPVVDANYVNVYGHDITERKKAEDELRLYGEITVNMSEGVYAIRASDGIIVYTNPKFEQMFGYGPGELIGKHVSLVNAPTEKSPQETAKEITDVLNKKGVWRGEILNIKKDGTPFWCYASVSTFEHTEHEKIWVTMHTDITERKKAEEEIVNLAKFPEENASPVYRISKDGVLLYANSASRRLILEDITEIGNKIPEKWLGMIKNVYDSGKRQRVEVELSGRVFLFEQVPVIEGGYVNSYATDITERKKAEERLLEHQAKLKAMASEMLMTEEHERQRLAVGLHDSVCQKLVLTKLALESSMNLVSDSNVLASLRIVCEGIGETIEKADSLTFELSNPVLRQLGFVIALEKYLTEEIRQKHGIAFELQSDEQLGTLQDEIKNCLFRVTRELLTNVVKHAQARKVKVSARESQSQIYVRVQDDGMGFKESQAGAKVSKTARFGLFSIREQLEYLGGHLEIESGPGRGTTATVVVPLRDKATV